MTLFLLLHTGATSIVASYWVYPVIGLAFFAIGAFLGRILGITNLRFFILYLLIGTLLLCLPALVGFMGYRFMPYGYLAISVYALLLGVFYLKTHHRIKSRFTRHWVPVIYLLILLGTGYCFFVLIFNLTNELQYGHYSATSIATFAFPLIFQHTLRLFYRIPAEIQDIWHFETAGTISDINTIRHDTLRVIEVELFKNSNDKKPVKIKAKAPVDMPTGLWFKRLIVDYNRNSPHSPIVDYSMESGVGWIFYTELRFWFYKRKYINYRKNFDENRLGNHDTIVVKRVHLSPTSKTDELHEAEKIG